MSDPITTQIEHIVNTLKGKLSGGGYICHCPAHEDNTASLSITITPEGKPLFKCFAGCEFASIAAALRDLSAPIPDFNPAAKRGIPSRYTNSAKEVYNKLVAVYKYPDGYTARYENDKGKKAIIPFFRQTEDPNVYKPGFLLKDGRALYNKHLIIQHPNAAIIIVEGEKCADYANSVITDKNAFIAVSWPGGCNAITKADWTPIRGRSIVLWPDYDKPGVEAMSKLAEILSGMDCEISVIDPSVLGLSDGGDIADIADVSIDNLIFDNPETLDRLLADFDSAKKEKESEVKKDQATARVIVVDLMDFIAEKLPPPEHMLGWVTTRSLNLIYALQGVGKTHVALNVAYAIASGNDFFGWKATKPYKVIYVDGEMTSYSIQKRLTGIALAQPREAERGYFRLITSDKQSYGVPNLSTPEGRKIYAALLEDADFMIFDNLSCLSYSDMDDNDVRSFQEIANWGTAQRNKGRAILFIHHAGKNGSQRGTSKKQDNMDTIIQLKRPPSYSPEEGAKFEVHFEKGREFEGVSLAPFCAQLTKDGNGLYKWDTSLLKDNVLEMAVQLMQEKIPQSDIMKELGISRSTLARTLRRAREEGKLYDGPGPKLQWDTNKEEF